MECNIIHKIKNKAVDIPDSWQSRCGRVPALLSTLWMPDRDRYTAVHLKPIYLAMSTIISGQIDYYCAKLRVLQSCTA